MAQFTPNKDIKMDAKEPRLDVLASRTNPLKVGKNVFQLVVQDDSGNASDPASVTVIVLDTERPTAVIDLVDASGVRNPLPEVTVPFGQAFTLMGDRSGDIGGTVSLWQWVLVQG